MTTTELPFGLAVEIDAASSRLGDLVYDAMHKENMSPEEMAQKMGIVPAALGAMLRNDENITLIQAVTALYHLGRRLDIDSVPLRAPEPEPKRLGAETLTETKVQYLPSNADKARVEWAGGQNPDGVLDPEQVYTVEHVEVHSLYTLLYLADVPGRFNSLHFVGA